MTQVIAVNGGSSSGKSGIGRCLQAILPDQRPAPGTDTVAEAIPASIQASDEGMDFAADGQVITGSEFRTQEAAWIQGSPRWPARAPGPSSIRSSSAARTHSNDGKKPWANSRCCGPASDVMLRWPQGARRLAEVIDRALTERPAIGFQSADELRRALLPHAG